jgi:hypothetical protein
MARSLLVPFAVICLAACGSKGGGGDDSSGSASGGTTSTSGTTTDSSDGTSATGATSTTGGSGTTDPSTTGGSGTTDPSTSGGTMSFVMDPDGGGQNECDPREQDCMDGEKCTAWANDGGGVWNANKCVPETGSGVPGDSCTIEGSGVSGLDDCAKGSICLFANQEGMGICIGFCEGANEDCPNMDPCIVANDGVLPLCLDGCDPLLQDCPGDQGCYDSPDGFFVCFADASGTGGADGDACPPADGENTCDPGLWCGPGSAGCQAVNCCTPYCDLTGPSCPAGDECTSFYGDPNNAPPGYENVGVCVAP